MKIAMTTFALRNWQPGASTLIEGMTPHELVRRCNEATISEVELTAGYAPFCKHLFIDNPTPRRCGFAPLTVDNRHLLRSGYVSRRDGELAVFERWFEGIDAPVANHLDIILYSHDQLRKEAANFPEEKAVPDCDWGIVSIIGVLEKIEPPMPPITQLRNALGREQGGSGAPIDAAGYARAVGFWKQHAAVR